MIQTLKKTLISYRGLKIFKSETWYLNIFTAMIVDAYNFQLALISNLEHCKKDCVVRISDRTLYCAHALPSYIFGNGYNSNDSAVLHRVLAISLLQMKFCEMSR